MSITPAEMKLLPPALFDQGGNLTVPESKASAVAAGIQARINDMPPEQRSVFLTTLKVFDMAPSADSIQNDYGSMGLMNDSASRLEDLLKTVGSSNILARIMVELAGQQRKDALDARLQAREQAKDTALEQAGKMEEAANKQRIGAVVSLALTVVASVVTIVGSSFAMKSANSGAQRGKDAIKAENSIGDVQFARKEQGLRKLEALEAAPAPQPARTKEVPEAPQSAKKDDVSLPKRQGENSVSGPENKPDPNAAKTEPTVPKADGDADAPATKTVGSEQEIAAAKLDLEQEKKLKISSEQKGLAQADAQQLNQEAQGYNSYATAVGQLAGAFGRYGEAEMNAQAKETEAEGARLSALAEMERGEGDIDREVQQALDEMIKSIINFIRERQEAEVNEMAAITKA